jgi:ligand-binding sensor domain-containing protein/two-component sensor histidine kinase
LAGLLKSQDKAFTYQHYGPEEGLNNTLVWTIKQAPNSLMYFSTANGIYSYDGYNFTKLKIPNVKTTFLRNIGLINGNIFVTNDEGVFELDLKSNSTKKLDYLKFGKQTADEIVINGDFAYNLAGEVSISCVNIKTNTLYEDQIRKKDETITANCIFKTPDNRVFVGRSDGLYEFEGPKQVKIKLLRNIPVYSIAMDHKGNLLLGTDDKIIVLDKNLRTADEYFPKFKPVKTFLMNMEVPIRKLKADRYGRLWFTTNPDNTLFLYENGNLYDVFKILNISTTLINSISLDKDQNIWISTFNDGVYFVQNPFLNNFSFKVKDKNLTVNEILLRGDHLLTATSNGLYGFNYKSYSVKTLSNPDEVFGEAIYNINSFQNYYYYSKTFGLSNNGTLLSGKTVLRFKPVYSKYLYLLNDKTALIGDQGSIYKINLSNEKVIDTILSFPDYRTKITSILQKENLLFVGTSMGLTIADLKTKTYSTLSDSLFNFPVNHISLINDKIYIAHEGGLSIYEDKKLITELNDIKLSAVKRVKAFDNHIWLATLNGLYMCNMNLDPITMYSKSSGLLSNTINDITFNENTACIATDRGISIVNAKELLNNRMKPDKVQIISVQIEDIIKHDSLNFLKLSASENNLTIKFASPIFNKPNRQYFRYKIDKEAWRDFTDFELTLASIQGGKHSIQIITSLDKINWSDPVYVDIEKEVAFAETAWLYITIGIAALFLIILISYLWIKQVQKKARKRIQEEQQINLLKHQAMNALLSPHFIFNSLTSIQNYINTNDSLRASEYLAKFSRLIRMIIEKAAQSQITLRDEIVRLNYYLDLEKERFKNKFDFKIEVDNAVNVDEISIPNMIIQPHAENSIIHGILPKHEHGTLTITFKKNKNNELVITIEDDGIGLIKAKEHAKSSHKSLGTSTISNILELNSKLYNKKQNVKMEDKSTLNPKSNGTIITLTLEL